MNSIIDAELDRPIRPRIRMQIYPDNIQGKNRWLVISRLKDGTILSWTHPDFYREFCWPEDVERIEKQNRTRLANYGLAGRAQVETALKNYRDFIAKFRHSERGLTA